METVADDELERIRAKLREELSALGRAKPTGATPLTEAGFDDFVRRHPIVLVDVWAAWCGPCRRMSPLVEELGRAWGGRVAVAKLDADQAPRVMERYRIQSIPTFLWFKDGALAGALVGVQPREAFDQVLAELEAA